MNHVKRAKAYLITLFCLSLSVSLLSELAITASKNETLVTLLKDLL
jgi:hypothetical protein